jgi:ribonuclease HI
LRETCEVELVTGLQYLKQGMTQYMARWKQTDGEPQIEDLYRTRIYGVNSLSWRLITSFVGLGS